MMLRITAFFLIVFSAALVAACGGDDDSSDPSGSATSGASVTPGATAPAVADPVLDSGLRELKRAELGEIEVPVGGVYYIDPKTLATQGGAAAPACEGFQFSFAWQVTEPFPPEEGALEWQKQQQPTNEVLSADDAGSEKSGCDPLQAVNKGEEALTVAVKYAIGVPE